MFTGLQELYLVLSICKIILMKAGESRRYEERGKGGNWRKPCSVTQ